jgi:GR25 family glycosyltransferase involved in LPS biosynthesis
MYQGFFINLDKNEARRKALTQHLEETGAAGRYQRIAAVDGRAVAHQYETKLDPGNVGCWLSHAKILEANREAKTHLHIIEDDTIFSKSAMSLFDSLLEFADAELSGWELIFTDIYVIPADGRACKDLTRTMKLYQQTKTVGLLDLHHVGFSGTSSYFVNWKAIDKYAKLMSSPGVDGLPIDLYLRGLVNEKVLKAYVTAPFLTSVSRNSLQSDISGEMKLSRAVFDTFRRAFFQDADLQSLDAEMQEFIKGLEPSLLEKIYLKALLFTLSDRYVNF